MTFRFSCPCHSDSVCIASMGVTPLDKEGFSLYDRDDPQNYLFIEKEVRLHATENRLSPKSSPFGLSVFSCGYGSFRFLPGSGVRSCLYGTSLSHLRKHARHAKGIASAGTKSVWAGGLRRDSGGGSVLPHFPR